MILTEEEAKTKWCPYAFTFGRLLHGDENAASSYGPQNRGATKGAPLDACRCIASACMAWRGKEELTDFPADVACHEDGWTKSGAPWLSAWEDGTPKGFRQTWTRRVGYCGLAGEP